MKIIAPSPPCLTGPCSFLTSVLLYHLAAYLLMVLVRLYQSYGSMLRMVGEALVCWPSAWPSGSVGVQFLLSSHTSRVSPLLQPGRLRPQQDMSVTNGSIPSFPPISPCPFRKGLSRVPLTRRSLTDSLALSEYPSSLTCVVCGLNLTFWYCYCPALFLTRLALTGR